MFDAVDFSEEAVFDGPLPCFSSDGKHVAIAQQYRMVVKEIETMAVVGLFSCLDRIEDLAWSPCNELVLCSMFTRGTVQVFSLTDSEWSCTFSEGLAGISHAQWCPSGEQVLLTSDFMVKLSVWSLTDQSCKQLPPSKHPKAGVSFSPDGTHLAILEVRKIIKKTALCFPYIIMNEVTVVASHDPSSYPVGVPLLYFIFNDDVFFRMYVCTAFGV